MKYLSIIDFYFSSRSEFRYLPTPRREGIHCRSYRSLTPTPTPIFLREAHPIPITCNRRINLPQITVVRGNNRAWSTNSFKQASQIDPSQTLRNQ